MSYRLLPLLPLLTSLVVSSCRTASRPAGSTPPGATSDHKGAATSGAGPRRVGLVVTGPISDGGWNEIAWKGCQQIKEQYGAEISSQLATSPEQFHSAFRGYAAAGYDLVFGHGAEFSDAAMAVGPKFPNTRFVVTGGSAKGGNVSHIRMGMEEGTYLLGLIGGSMTRSNRLGQIGGEPLLPVKQAFAAFEKGVLAANPKAVVTTTYLNSWNDASAGKEQARALIQQGADFLFPNADAAGNGVFQAVQESKAKGVLAFGANSDQAPLAPDVILASSVLDVPRAFLTVARSIHEGRFDGSPYVLGMKDGVVSLVYNPALKSMIPPAAQQRVEQARQDILSGKLKLVGE